MENCACAVSSYDELVTSEMVGVVMADVCGMAGPQADISPGVSGVGGRGYVPAAEDRRSCWYCDTGEQDCAVGGKFHMAAAAY